MYLLNSCCKCYLVVDGTTLVLTILLRFSCPNGQWQYYSASPRFAILFSLPPLGVTIPWAQSEQWFMFNALNKPSTYFHATTVLSMVKNYSRIFGDNNTELFSLFHPDISIVSFCMLAVRPLPLAAPNRALDHSVRFV